MHATLARRTLGNLVPPKIATPKILVRCLLGGDTELRLTSSSFRWLPAASHLHCWPRVPLFDYLVMATHCIHFSLNFLCGVPSSRRAVGRLWFDRRSWPAR